MDEDSPPGSLGELMRTVPQRGRVEWIGLRPGHRQPVRSVVHAVLRADRGIEGDRTARNPGGRRQVTLVQAEHLPVIGQFLGRDAVEPEALRRNLVVAGVNLAALGRLRFRVGRALLEGTGNCSPCRRMEETLGAGGFAAMRGHGGITAIVLEGGEIRVGDLVVPIPS